MVELDRNEMMEGVKQMKLFFEPMSEQIAAAAKFMKACYDSLVEAGFTPQEALQITKARGPFLVGNGSGDK